MKVVKIIIGILASIFTCAQVVVFSMKLISGDIQGPFAVSQYGAHVFAICIGLIVAIICFKSKNNLAERCKKYLAKGPPDHMEDYVPESITEIIISHGAQQKKLDEELMELAGITLMEADGYGDIEDPEIKEYMLTGAELVRAILES